MSGLLSLLPLLDGWNYHPYLIPTSTITTTPRQLKKIESNGWLITLYSITTDAYGTLRIRYRGAGELWQVVNIAPEPAFTLGAVQQDPSGYILYYNRPVPALTVGAYAVVGFSGNQGMPLPYVRDVIIEGFLGSSTTSASATISATAVVLELIDKPAFKKSLREFIGVGELSDIVRKLA